jgi:hypothetical protein
MTKRKITHRSAGELGELLERGQLKPLKDALSLLHSWGIHGAKYLPVLGKLLSHSDQEVVRLTMGIMLNYELFKSKKFIQFKEHLPVFQKLATTESPGSTQFLALDLIVKLIGPTRQLVPLLKKGLSRYPEEACDVVCRFGPVASDLFPDLIRLLKKSKDWDETWAAVDALGAIGHSAKNAVPILKELIKHKSGVIMGRACVALEKITGISRYRWPRTVGLKW